MTRRALHTAFVWFFTPVLFLTSVIVWVNWPASEGDADCAAVASKMRGCHPETANTTVEEVCQAAVRDAPERQDRLGACLRQSCGRGLDRCFQDLGVWSGIAGAPAVTR